VGASRAAWHLIGHLQTNKVARAVETFDVIESIDSARLARAVGRRAAVAGRRIPVLVEVNVSGEAAKTGAPPGELFAVLEAAASMSALELSGLMAMGPLTEDESRTRAAFAQARSLLDAAAARGLLKRPDGERGAAGAAAPELSMGMSDDFELAILEGSTMVRIGSALFGSRANR
jgi:pyridoxal phosphate enzyme (YggS family)